MKDALLTYASFAVFTTCVAGQAAAQTSTISVEPPAAVADVNSVPDGLGDIIVTAQKRSENLQKVPIVVAVATAEQLSNTGVTNVSGLKMIAPGVDVQANNGYAFPIIRGVGSKAAGAGLETPIAFYVDGVYYAAGTANILSFNNVSQVEVLKGPQGTLFGRNATGGVIQVSTRDPSHIVGGEASLTYGNYETVSGNIYLTGGLTDNLAVDIAVQGMGMGDGYGTNLQNGKDVYKVNHDVSIRSKWLWTLGSRTEARLTADYTDFRNSMVAQRLVQGGTSPTFNGPTYGGSRYDVDLDIQPDLQVKTGGLSVRVDHDLDIFQIASITAYRATKQSLDFDPDLTRTPGLGFTGGQKDHQFSQELQLLSPKGNTLKWALGAYYFNARGSNVPFESDFSGFFATATGLSSQVTRDYQNAESIAGFGQATYEVAPSLSLTAGLRYTSEERKLGDYSVTNTSIAGAVQVTGFPDKAAHFNKLTWRLAADYQFTSEVLGYLSYNRGFKSGGFNPNTQLIPAFAPEVLDAYEGGLKTTLFNRHLRLNTSAYYYDYKNVQVQRQAFAANGIYNGARARIYGAEMELQAQLTNALNVNLGYQYTHGRYASFQNAIVVSPRPAGGYTIGSTTTGAAGNDTILSPKHSLAAGATYTIPVGQGNIRVSATYYYNSGYFQDPDNVLRQPAYSVVNASLRWNAGGDKLFVAIWGNNLTDTAVANISSIQSLGGGVGVNRVNYAAPLTYGVTVGTKF